MSWHKSRSGCQEVSEVTKKIQRETREQENMRAFIYPPLSLVAAVENVTKKKKGHKAHSHYARKMSTAN
jgi:hypothetical protein